MEPVEAVNFVTECETGNFLPSPISMSDSNEDETAYQFGDVRLEVCAVICTTMCIDVYADTCVDMRGMREVIRVVHAHIVICGQKCAYRMCSMCSRPVSR